MVYVTLVMVPLLGLVSLGVDVGHMQLVQSQLQCAADAAARYAAAGLASGTTTAQNNAVTAAGDNTADGTAVVLNTSTDIQFGTWSTTTNTFTVLTGFAASGANAVQVLARRTAATGNAVNLSFGPAIGKSTADVTATSIALATPGQPYGLVGLSSVTLSNCTEIDSYNSSLGTYAGTAASNAYVASNGNVNLSGFTLGGTVSYGPSGSFTGSVSKTSGVSSLSTALSYATPSAGSYATTNSNSNVSSYVSGGSFSINSGTCNMPGGTYYFTNFNVMGSGVLNCQGPVTIYVTGAMQIAGTVDTYQNIPSNLQILGTGSGTLQVTAGGSIYCDLYAPSATVKILAAGSFYGALVGNTLQIMASATVHEDDSLTFGTTSIATVQ